MAVNNQLKKQRGIEASRKIGVANRDLQVLINDIANTMRQLNSNISGADDPLSSVVSSLSTIRYSLIPNLNTKLSSLEKSVYGYSNYIYR